MANKTIITRFPPSPTGELHIGSIRTALFNYLFAHHHNGKFYLRIEDTDQERLVVGATERIKKDLIDFGLTWDNSPVMVQSERKEIYKQAALELVEKDCAYYCFCTKARLEDLKKNQELLKRPPMYDECCRGISKKEALEKIGRGDEYVIRLKVPETGKIKFNDLVRNEIEIDWATVDDQVLIKSGGMPTYHLANVIDDHEMEVSHVIRAEEWLPSTPKHILLYQYFGWDVPLFAHPPMILNPDHTKMSKRFGDVSVRSFLGAGYLPEALINFLVFLGWNPKTAQEFFTLPELVMAFDIEQVNKAGAIFDRSKLDYFNNHYIRKYQPEELFDKIIGAPENEKYIQFIKDKNFSKKILEIIQPRLITLNFEEIWSQVSFFYELFEYDWQILIFKKSDKEKTTLGLERAIRGLEQSTDDLFLSREKINELLQVIVKENNLANGDVFWPVRAALSSLPASPPPAELIWALGAEESLRRLHLAISKLL